MKRHLITVLAELSTPSSSEGANEGSSSATTELPMLTGTASLYDETTELLVVEALKQATARERTAEARMRLRKRSLRRRRVLQKHLLNATERNAETRARLLKLSPRTRTVLRRHLVRAANNGYGHTITHPLPPTLEALRAALVAETPSGTPPRPVKWLGAVTGWAASREDS